MLSLGSAKAWPRTSPGEPGTEGEYHRGGNLDGEWQEELLRTQLHPDKPYGLVWEMNSGPVLAGETSRDGAARELREEAGLRCARLREKRFYQ